MDKTGFYLLLGGLPYISKLDYERLEPIFIGASFNQNFRDALLGYPDKNASVKRFLEAHYKMDLLFICGILKQPSSKAISPDTIKKIRRKLIRQIGPACNEILSEDKVYIEIEHQGSEDRPSLTDNDLRKITRHIKDHIIQNFSTEGKAFEIA